MTKRSYPVLMLLIVIVTFSPNSVATVPLELEPNYARAALAYQKGQYERSFKLVREMLREEPGVLELLELKALLLHKKNLGSEARPLHYQLIEAGYKPMENHFHLGELEYAEKMFPSARRHFEQVAQSLDHELALRAQFYLLQISEALNDPAELVRIYLATRQLAGELLKREISPETLALAKQALAFTDRELRAFDRAGLYANVGLTAVYNSNLFLSPDNKVGAANGVFRYSVAYPTSPLRRYQFIPSYSGSLNYFGNPQAKTGQFITQTINLYVTGRPLALTNYGFQLEVSGNWQYRTVTGTSNLSYQKYGVFGSLGPYFKVEISPKWVLGIDVFFRPRKLYVDSLFATSQARTGWAQDVTFSISRSTLEHYWNPEITLAATWQQTRGEEFRSRRLGFDLSNTFFLSKQLLLNVSAALSAVVFPDGLLGARYDQVPAVAVALVYRVTPQLSLIGSARFSKNLSSSAANRSSSFNASVGASLLF